MYNEYIPFGLDRTGRDKRKRVFNVFLTKKKEREFITKCKLKSLLTGKYFHLSIEHVKKKFGTTIKATSKLEALPKLNTKVPIIKLLNF